MLPIGNTASQGERTDRSATTFAAMATSDVLQLRLVVEVDDFDAAVAFYRDVLGLPEQAAFEGDGDARVIILDAGRATLELANTAQVEMIDRLEVGHRVSPKFRVAFEVTDGAGVTDRVVAGGAELIAAPARPRGARSTHRARRATSR